MMGPCGVVAMLLLHAGQASPLNGTWELTRIFRAGPVPSTRAVPIDSTVYLRITLETHVGDWISGRLYRRYRGEPDRSKVEAGPLRGEGRFIIGVEIEKPRSEEHTSELQSRLHLVCRLLLEKKKKITTKH